MFKKFSSFVINHAVGFIVGVMVALFVPKIVPTNAVPLEVFESSTKEQNTILSSLLAHSEGELTRSRKLELLEAFKATLESVSQMELHNTLNNGQRYYFDSRLPSLDEVVRAGLSSCTRSYWDVLFNPSSIVLSPESFDKIASSMYALKKSCDYYYLKDIVKGESWLDSLAAYRLNIYANNMGDHYLMDYRYIVDSLQDSIKSIKNQIRTLKKEI